MIFYSNGEGFLKKNNKMEEKKPCIHEHIHRTISVLNQTINLVIYYY